MEIEIEESDFPQGKLDKVEYKNDRIPIDVNEKTRENLFRALFVKAKCWKHEDEVRLVCRRNALEYRDRFDRPFAILRKSRLTKVYFGCRSEEGFRKNVIRLIQKTSEGKIRKSIFFTDPTRFGLVEKNLD